MNRKGHTPTLLLFVTALILIVFALFSFASFNGKFEGGSGSVSKTISDVVFFENYMVKESKIVGEGIISKIDDKSKGKFAELIISRSYPVSETKDFYDKITKGDFKFEFDNGWKKYLFEMKGIVIESSEGANKFRRVVDINIEFDGAGKVIWERVAASG